MKGPVTIAATALLLTMSTPSFALQSLIETPYPQTLGSTAEDITSGSQTHYHQNLIRDPVPETLGPDAQGNPSTFRTGYHRQRLIRSPYPRYDGSGGYGAPGY
jgi:hypothetical protein